MEAQQNNFTLGFIVPAIVADALNSHLAQYDPLNMLLSTVCISAITFIVFPRVKYLISSLVFLLVITEVFRAYQEDAAAEDLEFKHKAPYFAILALVGIAYLHSIGKFLAAF